MVLEYTDEPCKESSDFDIEKFKQFLHYVIFKTSGISNVGKTVLYKILYFTDFNYYELFEKKLSGETYLRYPYGPAPCNFEEVIDELEKDGLIKETSRNYRYQQTKFTSTIEPDTSKFTNEELKFIDASIDKYSGFNATEISEHSHKDTPYILADDFEDLDYELVFYRSPELSVRRYEDEDDID